MNDFLGTLLSLLLLYKYFALFAVIFSAAVIVPLPTNSLLLAAGAFASQGYFSFSISLIVSVVANIAGDSFGYFLARKYGRLAIRFLHVRMPSFVEKLEQYLRSHTGLTIFVTRFFGSLDSVANIFSGLVGISFKKFLFYDFLGNFVSICGVLYAGYLLGVHWQDFSKFFDVGEWVLCGVIIIIFAGYFFWSARRRKRKLLAKQHERE